MKYCSANGHGDYELTLLTSVVLRLVDSNIFFAFVLVGEWRESLQADSMPEIIDDFRNLMLKFQDIIEVIEVPVFDVEKYESSCKM